MIRPRHQRHVGLAPIAVLRRHDVGRQERRHEALGRAARPAAGRPGAASARTPRPARSRSCTRPSSRPASACRRETRPPAPAARPPIAARVARIVAAIAAAAGGDVADSSRLAAAARTRRRASRRTPGACGSPPDPGIDESTARVQTVRAAQAGGQIGLRPRPHDPPVVPRQRRARNRMDVALGSRRHGRWRESRYSSGGASVGNNGER